MGSSPAVGRVAVGERCRERADSRYGRTGGGRAQHRGAVSAQELRREARGAGVAQVAHVHLNRLHGGQAGRLRHCQRPVQLAAARNVDLGVKREDLRRGSACVVLAVHDAERTKSESRCSMKRVDRACASSVAWEAVACNRRHTLNAAAKRRRRRDMAVELYRLGTIYHPIY